MVKLWLPPEGTDTLPLGEMLPPAPALAVMVNDGRLPKTYCVPAVAADRPITCTLVPDVVPVVSVLHAEPSQTRAAHAAVFTPASTSEASNWKSALHVAPVPFRLVSDQ